MVGRALLMVKLVTAMSISAHPLHTTLADVTVDHQTVRAVVRVFSDDVAAAIARRNHSNPKAPTDADASAYVTSSLTLTNSGSATSLRSCGVKRSGDLLWVCVEASPTGGIHGLSLKDSILCELYADQVNIVQLTASNGGLSKSILFTRGDGAKLLL